MALRRALKKTMLLLVLMVAGQLPLEAQRLGRVKGLVVDGTTGAAVPLVLVSILGHALADTTDAEGQYEIRGIPAGPVQVFARRIGFAPLTSPWYALSADSTLLVHFALTPQAITLDPLVVRGEAEEVRAAIGAKVLTPQDLPGRGNIITALQGVVPGIQTSGRRDDAGVRARQSHASMLYVIDGVVVTPPLTFYIDTQDVECVEVRRGYRASQDFRTSISGQTYSGVILIWTRGSLAPQPRECKST